MYCKAWCILQVLWIASCCSNSFEMISKNVDTIYSWSNAEKAKTLFMDTCQFQIIVIVRKILSYPRGITRKLQGIDIDLAQVMSDVKLLKEN